jgi:hypothetical protein
MDFIAGSFPGGKKREAPTARGRVEIFGEIYQQLALAWEFLALWCRHRDGWRRASGGHQLRVGFSDTRLVHVGDQEGGDFRSASRGPEDREGHPTGQEELLHGVTSFPRSHEVPPPHLRRYPSGANHETLTHTQLGKWVIIWSRALSTEQVRPNMKISLWEPLLKDPISPSKNSA